MSATIGRATRDRGERGDHPAERLEEHDGAGVERSASPRGYSPVVLANMAAIGADHASPTSAAKAR